MKNTAHIIFAMLFIFMSTSELISQTLNEFQFCKNLLSKIRLIKNLKLN